MRIFFWRRREEDLEDELRTHLEMAARDRSEQIARVEFGNVGLIKETTRQMWRGARLDRLLEDVRYGLRWLRRSPGFTAVAVLSLALGIGANTAIFTVCNALMLRQLPVQHPEQLVTISTTDDGDTFGQWPYPTFEKFRALTDVFSNISAVAALDRSNIDFRGSGGGMDASQVHVDLVSGTYFLTLGLQPAEGRLFTGDDDRVPGGHPVAVISYNYWLRRFSRGADVVGRAFALDGTTYRILGVAPEGFTGDWVERPTDIWIPIAMQSQVMLERPGLLTNPNPPWVRVVARMKPGVAAGKAAAEVKAAFVQAVAEWRNLTPRMRESALRALLKIESSAKGYSEQRGLLRRPLMILVVTVGFVLLIACMNIATLLLARSAGREREMAVRLALGAGRSQILGQVLIESVLLATLGGLLGMLVATWGTNAFSKFLVAGQIAMQLDLHPDGSVLAFTSALCFVTGILFGLIPALRSAKVAVSPALARRGLEAPGRFGVGKMLVISQVALSLVLVIGAGLFLQTLRNLKSQDLGFERNQLLLFWTAPDQEGRQGAKLASLYETVQERLSALPGVRSASPSAFGLLAGSGGSPVTNVEGYTGKADEERFTPWSLIGPGFFDTAGIPRWLGRDFTARDNETAPRVAIVNESFARHYFGDASPVGKHFGMRRDTGAPIEIVGVVKDAKYDSLRESQRRMIYIPYRQDLFHLYTMCVLVRPRADVPGFRQMARDALRGIDPNLPILRIDTADEQVDASLSEERLIASISSFFGVLAVLLACLGLYGVMSYLTARRTNEIGIRFALGATGRNVLGMVLGESVWLVAVGIAAGVPLTLAATRFISSRLFGVSATDPVTIASAAMLMLMVATVSGLLPARRAAKVDPMVALRYE